MATRRQPAVPGAHLIREAEAISAGAVAVFLALSFLSFSPDAPPANLGGPVGQALAGTELRALGVAAYLFPLYLGYFTVALLRRGAEGFGGLRLVGAALLVARIRRRPPAAEEPSATPRRPKLPILLDDAVEPPPEAPADKPPPIIREPERRPEAPRRAKRSELQEELFAEDTYRLPALNLLDPPVRTTQPLDEAALHASSRILETKLADFQVAGKVVAVRPGPVITTFE